jgi:hypothetical protein
MAKGIETGKFGAWLSGHLPEGPCGAARRVFYDHGDQALHANVAALQAFYGEQVTSMNRLADVDVAIVDAAGNVEVLIEIEESAFSAKKIVGDVFAIAMCNRVAVKRPNATAVFAITPSTVLFVAGVANPRGKKHAQVEEVILPRLRQFAAPDGAFRLADTRFVLADTIELVISQLEHQVLHELGCQDAKLP